MGPMLPVRLTGTVLPLRCNLAATVHRQSIMCGRCGVHESECVRAWLQAPEGPLQAAQQAVLSALGQDPGADPHRLRLGCSGGGGGVAPQLAACLRVLAADPQRLAQLQAMLAAGERHKALAGELLAPLAPSPPVGAGAEGAAAAAADADALQLLKQHVQGMLAAAEGSLQRLGAVDAATAAPAAARAEGETQVPEAGAPTQTFQHFARVYVEGLVAILRDTLALQA
jgi:hypothetical protein